MGLGLMDHLDTWMVHFIEKIRTSVDPIDWGTLLCNSLNDHIVMLLIELKVYITSYIVYLLAVQKIIYPRLTKKGSLWEPGTWPYIVYH